MPAVVKKSRASENNLLDISLDKNSKLCIDTVRVLSADMVEKAKSGHPGAPMGCAPMAYVLWTHMMKYSSSNPNWIDRDRFILSNGHSCALQYAMLYLLDYDVSLDDLQAFRQYDSKTPGHPENFLTSGVEVCTGPLGQGITNAVGMAIGEAHLAALFNKPNFNIMDHYTFVICGDGCLQEGIASEAASLAGHLGLGKLIVLYDDNNITIDGSTDLSFSEDVTKRYEAYGWHTITLGHDDVADIESAVEEAKSITDKPTMIKIKTIIGEGSCKAGTAKCHGAPLGAEDLAAVKVHYGFDPQESFVIPDAVKSHYNIVKGRNDERYNNWTKIYNQYKSEYPDLARELERRMMGELPENWENSLPKFTDENPNKATRVYSEMCLNGLAAVCPELMGGSADLTPSNLTSLKCSGDFQKDTPQGRYIRYGVREHAMVAINNGLFAHGGFRPFCATFLIFYSYAMGCLRLSSLSNFGTIFIATHDSIYLGEDGPSHQPIEILSQMRGIPGLAVVRPADGRESVGAYKLAMSRKNAPTLIVATRQTCNHISGSSSDSVSLGAYVLKNFGNSTTPLILIATGSEVDLCCKVAEQLFNDDETSVRVISMPCREVFDESSVEFKKSLIPDGSAVMSVECASTKDWHKYAHAPFGINTFGKSAPGKEVYERFGFTVDNLVAKARVVVNAYPNGAPTLFDAPVLC